MKFYLPLTTAWPTDLASRPLSHHLDGSQDMYPPNQPPTTITSPIDFVMACDTVVRLFVGCVELLTRTIIYCFYLTGSFAPWLTFPQPPFVYINIYVHELSLRRRRTKCEDNIIFMNVKGIQEKPEEVRFPDPVPSSVAHPYLSLRVRKHSQLTSTFNIMDTRQEEEEEEWLRE